MCWSCARRADPYLYGVRTRACGVGLPCTPQNGSKQEGMKGQSTMLGPSSIPPWRNSEDDDMAIILDVQHVSEDG